ncbi:MAG: class B sortase [Bacilli bacterium]
MKSNKRKLNSRKNVKLSYCLLIGSLIISIILIIISTILMFKWHNENNKTKEMVTNTVNDVKHKIIKDSKDTIIYNKQDIAKDNDYWDFIKMPLLSVDFEKLIKKNQDTVGWLQVNGTSINYPIVQTNDNSYYLTHAFDKTQNSAGWLFADYRNDFKKFDANTIIYGHARLNNTMFGTLKKIINKSWQLDKDNQVILISTPAENTSWQVFSVYTIPVETYYLTTDFTDDDSYQQFLTTIKARSVYSYDVPLNAIDKVLTLSTCKDNSNKTRIVLHAKLIKKQLRNVAQNN